MCVFLDDLSIGIQGICIDEPIAEKQLLYMYIGIDQKVQTHI